MNSAEKLVMMVNQIAANLMHEADPAAVTADHIRQFWSPHMRAQLAERVKAEGVGALSPTAQNAFALLVQP